LVDERGVPLSIVVTGANVNDVTMVAKVLEAKVVKPKENTVQNLCADKGYVGSGKVMEEHGYTPHIRPRGEEADKVKRDPTYKPRRWVVELSHSWMNRFRKLSPRYEKTLVSCLGLVELAAAMIVLNKVVLIYG
jgi:putative transposase